MKTYINKKINIKFNFLITIFLSVTFYSSVVLAGNYKEDWTILFPNVSFKEFGDPGWIRLQANDHILTGDFYYTFIEYQDITEWQPNEAFQIVSAKDLGIGIIRNNTKKFYRVHFNAHSHPIDIMQDTCAKDHIIARCLETANTLWADEITNIHKDYLKYLKHKKEQDNFLENIKLWETYWQHTHNFYNDAPRYEGGTMGNIINLKVIQNLLKARAFILYGFYEQD